MNGTNQVLAYADGNLTSDDMRRIARNLLLNACKGYLNFFPMFN